MRNQLSVPIDGDDAWVALPTGLAGSCLNEFEIIFLGFFDEFRIQRIIANELNMDDCGGLGNGEKLPERGRITISSDLTERR